MRHALALHFAPLMLRLGLGLTFVWAGAAKLTQEMPVTPDNRDQLAQWGVIEGSSVAETDGPDLQEQMAADRDRMTLDEGDSSPPADMPGLPPADAPADAPTQADELTEPEPIEESDQDQPNASLVALQAEPTETVRRVYGLALLINARANPTPNDDGTAPMPLWPPQFATGQIPVYFAWGAAVTELVAGIAVLFGFFTRLSALPLAGTMIVAAWLTQIGPAIQSGNATLGVLPPGMFDLGPAGYVYTQFLWQIALLLMGVALFCTGAGFFSIDRLLFGPMIPSTFAYGDEADDDIEFVPMSGRQGTRPSEDD